MAGDRITRDSVACMADYYSVSCRRRLVSRLPFSPSSSHHHLSFLRCRFLVLFCWCGSRVSALKADSNLVR